ncbi:hypothetical protein FJTKL_08067 [Diaporthe vaccinii]|uniref:Uncharacterized protein n=1 Tax=Diaporthe vaccinii TaxID=105482 RepID=A0ABR4FEF1_9PEZI
MGPSPYSLQASLLWEAVIDVGDVKVQATTQNQVDRRLDCRQSNFPIDSLRRPWPITQLSPSQAGYAHLLLTTASPGAKGGN